MIVIVLAWKSGGLEMEFARLWLDSIKVVQIKGNK